MLLRTAGVVCLVLVALGRYGSELLSPLPLPDEEIFLAAFERVAGGGSPYRGPYNYPPFFAFFGSWVVAALDVGGALALFRSLNLLGLALLVWCSFAQLEWPWWRQLVGGALVVALSPGVRLGLEWGNLSFAISGMLLVGLLLRRRPALAGPLLGFGVALKPIGAVAVLCLLGHRSRCNGRAHVVTGAVASVLAAGLVVAFPYLDELLALGDVPGGVGRSVALARLLFCLGLRVDALWLTGLVSLVSVLAMRLLRPSEVLLLPFCLAATLAATPVVWSHTLLLSLPMQIPSLAIAARRYSQRPERGAWRKYEPVFVVLAVLSLHLCEGVGGIEDYPLLVQALVVAIPCGAPLALTWYLFRTLPDSQLYGRPR